MRKRYVLFFNGSYINLILKFFVQYAVIQIKSGKKYYGVEMSAGA